MASELTMALIEASVATTLAILLVVALRAPARRHLGAVAAHALWACVPLACAAVLLPARTTEIQWAEPLVTVIPVSVQVTPALPVHWPVAWWLVVWGAGVAMTMMALLTQQHRFTRGLGRMSEASPGVLSATADQGLPAALGILRPRIVVPADFRSRYTEEEQVLVLCHERLHIRRGDLVANLLASMMRCLFWFNPLIHVAARLHRLDQEFACDAMVMARHPAARRAYGEAMLKAQLAGAPLPVGCHWSNHHPLKERIAMLRQPLPTRTRRVVASAFVLVSFAASAMAAWAAQPANALPGGEDFHYRIAATLDVDGEKQSLSLRDGPGRPVGIVTSTKAGREWRLQMVVTPKAGDQVKIEGDLHVDGAMVSSPVLIAALDREAAIQVTSADGSSTFALAMTVSRQPGPPRPDATVVSRQPAPDYPDDAKARQQSGQVMLKLRVGPDGRVREAIVEKSVPAGVFDEASLAAAKRWTFDPPLENGVAVEGWVRVPIRFDIHGDGRDENDAASDPPMAWTRVDMAQPAAPNELACDAMRQRDPRKAVVDCGIRLAQTR